jgi:streptogrisin C
VRTGLATAAHCPDQLEEIGRSGERTSLEMVGAWGARYQDVQIHVADAPMLAQFRGRAPGGVARPLVTWRNRESTRAGDFVCHRGQSSGYSCAEVTFVDFAPPGELCAGLCPPTWVAVAASSCHRGDSGGPVFLGTTAFGLLKGASLGPDGRCNVYYYMSTDYLPPGWTLLHSGSASAAGVSTLSQ